MHNNLYNNQSSQRHLFESLEYKDLEGMMKPTIHVDEFSSKMGEDADIIVLSFYVRDKQAAKDLTNWFETGYDFVLDADTSPGEIKPNRYLTYVELRRRNSVPKQINQMLDDLNTLTEFNLDDWIFKYEDKQHAWDPELFAKLVPLTPQDYRQEKEDDLNEWRVAAGLDTKPIFERDNDIKALQSAAGI